MALQAKAELLNELMSELEAEIIEDKKWLVEMTEEDDKETENIVRMASIMDGLDDKMKDLACKEDQLKEQLSAMKTHKLKLRQEKLSNDEKSRCLQVDVVSLDKDCLHLRNNVAAYEAKIQRNKNPRISRNDYAKLSEEVDKVNACTKLSGIKFTSSFSDKTIEGYIYNTTTDTLKRFCFENDGSAKEKLQNLIQTASHPGWAKLRGALSELGLKP